MSSVKRRKVDNDVPSGLLRKKHAVKEAPKTSTSSSPEPPTDVATKEQAEKVPVKSFKDLVGPI
jgi:ATP-dependent RNA helicase DDX47/RRP3